jgi:hypothetical protein
MHTNYTQQTLTQYKQTCTDTQICFYCAGIELATSCVVGEYSYHYAESAVIKPAAEFRIA